MRFNVPELTVVWQGIKYTNGWGLNPGIPDTVEHSTVVRPSEYGFLEPSNEQLGELACSEVHDGENPYDEINVLFVYYGALQPIIEDEDDAELGSEPD